MTYVWLNDRSAGPFDGATLELMLRGHAISGETLAWREGLAEWVTLSSLLATEQAADAIPAVPAAYQNSVANQDLLLAALDGNNTEVRNGDLATVVASRLALEGSLQENAPFTLYRWPQFGADIGVFPAGTVPPQRTAANGTRIEREEFMDLLARAEAGDMKALFDIADIAFENADIQVDAVIAALLRSKGEEYFALAVAKKHAGSQMVARAKSTLKST